MIEQQWIDVRVERQEGAHALLDRIGEANRERWLPLIDRLLDEHDRPGEVIRIDRIDLDLGRFTEAGIGEAERRLETALRAALRRAVPPPSVFPGQEEERGDGEIVRLAVAAALVEALEYWLLHGSWPYGAALDPATAPAELLERLIEEEPKRLTAMLHRRGRSERVLRRLLKQIPEALLERLLERLDPQSASWILGYMAETRAVHAAERLIEATPEAFERTLWQIVLRDALHGAGLRSNRRSFVAAMVADLASAGGLTFAVLLRQLTGGLRTMPRSAAGADTLLSVLSEIGEAADGEGMEAEPDEGSPLGFETLAPMIEGKARPAGPSVGTASSELAPAGAGDPLDRLAEWLEGPGPAAVGRLEPSSSASHALEAAAAADPVGTRRVLRRFARADAGKLLARLGASDEPAMAASLILPPGGAAETAAAFLRQARCSAEEGALLLGLAAAMPVSTPPTVLVRRWIAALAGRRGERPERLAETLRGAAVAAGGEHRRRLAHLLIGDGGTSRTERLAAARRGRALRLLRALSDGRPAALVAAASADAGEREDAIAAIAGLAGGGAADPETALARFDPRALRSLIALFAPRSSDGRALLSRRLSRAGGPQDLARIAARLMAGRGVLAAPDPAAPPEPMAAARKAVEAAIARGGSALDGAAFRSTAALLSRRRPGQLLAMLAATDRRRGAAAAARLMADPDHARFLFAGLPERMRGDAATFARLLAGQGVVSAEALAAGLLDAAGAAAGGRDGIPVAAWIDRVRRLATVGERRRLDRLLDRRGEPLPGFKSGPPLRPQRQFESSSTGASRATIGQGAASSAAARAAPGSSAVRSRLARKVSSDLLLRLLVAARPAEARALVGAADAVAAAIRAQGGSIAAAALREAMLHAAAGSAPGGAVEALLGRLLALHVAERDREAVARRLLERARAIGRGALLTAVEEWLYNSAPRPKAERRAVAQAGEPELRHQSGRSEPAPFPQGRSIAVANAGLVLAGAYLPQLFGRLELAAPGPDGRLGWRSPESADRAVHLLQFLADERCDAPEPALALNKLLCGLDPALPALPSIVITPTERAICGSLLEAMIANWDMLRNSSTAALRETFLQREGRLVRDESGWKLQVERKVLDILLDSLPWSFAPIFNAWMPDPLAVEW